MKRVLDVCCGSKMFYFDKENPDVEFCDIREVEKREYYPNRYFEVKPDTRCDFTDLPFDDESFKVVVFDPPHLAKIGDKSWTMLKYGRLDGDWRKMLGDGFMECMRVLDDDGVLIFKWSEIQIPLKEVLSIFPFQPLLGERRGRNKNTHWLIFMKPGPIEMERRGIKKEHSRECRRKISTTL